VDNEDSKSFNFLEDTLYLLRRISKEARDVVWEIHEATGRTYSEPSKHNWGDTTLKLQSILHFVRCIEDRITHKRFGSDAAKFLSDVQNKHGVDLSQDLDKLPALKDSLEEMDDLILRYKQYNNEKARRLLNPKEFLQDE